MVIMHRSQAGVPLLQSTQGYAPKLFFDGRDWNDVVTSVKTITPLALSPLVSEELSHWINSQNYFQLFEKVFGTNAITAPKIAMAIAAYKRFLYSNQAPFDFMIATQDPSFLTLQEKSRQVFMSQGCNACHTGALFSNEEFQNIGVSPNAEDSGRFAVTGVEADRGKFKATSLRSLQFRTSFMHTDRLTSLEEVVELYDRGGDFANPNLDTRITPLFLSNTQKTNLVSFLGRPLTDPRVTNETGPFSLPALYAGSSREP